MAISNRSDGSGGVIGPDMDGTADLARLMVEANPLPMWVCECRTGAILSFNPAFRALFKVDRGEDLILSDIVSETERNRDVFDRLERDGSLRNASVLMDLDGTEAWLQVSGDRAALNGESVLVCSIVDTRGREEGDETIRKARDVLRDAIESLSEGFALYDDDNRLILCNERYRDMNKTVADLLQPGLSWEILMRESARRGVYADAIGREEQWVSDRLKNGIEYIQDFELNQSDGTSCLVSVHPTNLGGFVVTRTDITDRKQAEAVEREGDMLVRQVLEASPAAVVMARLGDGQILYRSPSAEEMFGKSKSARDFYLSPADRADYITDLMADGRVDDRKMTLINGKGEEFPALIYGRIVEFRGEEAVVTTTIDLTEQNAAEALIRQVLEACPVPILMAMAETGDLLFRSPETTALFGHITTTRAIYVDPADRDRHVARLRERGFVNDEKIRLKNAAGEIFWGAVSSRLIAFRGEEVIVSNTRDLTEELRIEDELENQRNLIFQNEKMSALGELLAGVAHELNNPLSVVVGHALMLQEEATEPDILRRVDKIGGAAERCAKIVKTFLAMARQQPTKMEPVDVNGVIATAVDVAGYGRQHENMRIETILDDTLPDIMADADQITQVIINLVINAEQAISKSGIGNRIVVKTRPMHGGGGIKVIVQDNGPGVPENLRARIFEPFFTTKDVGDGTGIGLAFCHRIIHSHGGQIWLDPTRKKGSRFCISLPLAREADMATPEADIPDGQGHAKRILVVDDEPDVAELIAEILKRDGFAVDYANSGDGALELLATNRYDLVLSDLNMPGVDGRGLYEAILRDHRDLAQRTGFITGDTMGVASQGFLKDYGRPFLEKPVAPTELRKLVQTLLTDAETGAE